MTLKSPNVHQGTGGRSAQPVGRDDVVGAVFGSAYRARDDVVGAVFGSAYRATAVLERGYPVQSLLGTDLRSGSAVVIKTAPAAAVSRAAWLRLQHDVEALSQIDRSCLAPPSQLSSRGRSICA